MQGRVIRAAAVVYVVLKAAGVSAAPTLTYDLPILAAIPGSTVFIGATLSLAPTDNPIHAGSALFLGQPEDINADLFGTPAYYFARNSSWTPPAEDPLADLNVPAGSSVHLDLGSIALGTALPPGDYTTDIGIYESCTIFCLVFPFSPPNFADAGLLAIDVTEAPEPATLLLLITGLLGLATIRRKAQS